MLLELGAMEVGLPDRSRNPKPRTQLPLARKRGYQYLYLSLFHPSISFHEPNPTESPKEKSQSDAFKSKLRYQEAHNRQG